MAFYCLRRWNSINFAVSPTQRAFVSRYSLSTRLMLTVLPNQKTIQIIQPILPNPVNSLCRQRPQIITIEVAAKEHQKLDIFLMVFFECGVFPSILFGTPNRA